MSKMLPYLVSPGSIKTALERIANAATPERFTTDFVTNKLLIKGGTGTAIIPFMKKIGFVASDGSPTDIYKKYRHKPTAGQAVADAIAHGYKALAEVNEDFYNLSDKDTLALIISVTGAEAESSAAKLTASSLKQLKGLAKFDATASVADDVSVTGDDEKDEGEGVNRRDIGTIGMNLAYTINLNLPATSDQAVFNAIFRSLREHLLSK